MYFKKALVVALSSLLLISCDLPLNDEPPDVGNPEFKALEGVQCLSNVLPTMERFMAGTATSSEVGASWDCFESGIHLFSKYVKGREKDKYTAREITSFFQKYYLNNIPIRNELLAEIMKIKQLFVGGENNTFTKDDLNRLAVFSQEMKIISLKVLPYMRVFSFNWKVSGYAALEDDVHYFEDANISIQEGMKDLATLIEKNGQKYELVGIVTLLAEMSRLYGSTEWPLIGELRRTLPLIYKLKKTLTGGDESVVAANEWRRFSLLASRGYIQYLRYYYFIKGAQDIGSAPELVYVTRSFDDLFSYFGDMVGDKPGSKFTRGELLELLSSVTQFFPQFKVSDAFLLEFMKVKMVFFGGNLDEFTPADFEFARKKLDYFRDLTERFLNYIHVYAYSWTPGLINYDQSIKYFERAEDNLYQFGVKLGSTAEAKYDLNDLGNLAREFENLYPSNATEFSAMKSINKYLPLIINVKNLAFTDDSTVIGKTQLGEFLGIGAQIYGRSLFYNYFLKPKKVHLTAGNGLVALNKFVQDTTKLFIDKFLDRKPNQTITFAELDRVFLNIKKIGLVSQDIRPQSFSELMKVVFHKMLLTPEKRLANKLPAGFSKEATQTIREEFSVWFQNEQFADQSFQGVGGEGLTQEKIQEKLKLQRPTDGIKELIMIFETPQSLAYDEQNRLEIGINKLPYSRMSLTYINASRTLVRLGIRSYAAEIKRIKDYSGITKPEAVSIYDDLKPLLIDLKIVEPDKKTFAESRFREGNLFTPRANGDGLFNFIEGSDLVVAMLSGLKIDNLFREKIEEDAPQSPKCEVSRTPKEDRRQILVECFIKKYRENLHDVFSSMPEMRDYLEKLVLTEDEAIRNRIGDETEEQIKNQEVFREIALNLLKAGGYVPEKHKEKVFVADLALVPHIMQYIETVISRYDLNHDGILNKNEAMASFPLFKDTLSEVAGGKLNDDMLRALLAWMLVKGKQPEGISEYAKFLIWCFQESKWNIQADRRQLAKILGLIAEKIEENANKPTIPKEAQKPEEGMDMMIERAKQDKAFKDFMEEFTRDSGG